MRPGVIDLVIDPGRAFGTGAHPTTRLCLELLLELEPAGSLCDLGCGSGVLSIAAARLGFGPVTALDSDRLAVEATVANARDNGVALERVERANLREQPAPAADVVVANLMRPLLLRVAELMPERAAGADRLRAARRGGGRGGGGVRAAAGAPPADRPRLERAASRRALTSLRAWEVASSLRARARSSPLRRRRRPRRRSGGRRSCRAERRPSRSTGTWESTRSSSSSASPRRRRPVRRDRATRPIPPTGGRRSWTRRSPRRARTGSPWRCW